MVISDDVRGLRLRGDVFDSFLPVPELSFAVQLVVAVVAIVGIEPLIVVASMQTDVADGRGNVLGRSERASEDRLIDIAKGHILLGEGRERLRVVPAGVADLYHPRIFDELTQQAVEILAVQRRVLE